MNTLTFEKLKLPSHPDKEFWPITLCPALFVPKAYGVIPSCTPNPSKIPLSKRLPFPAPHAADPCRSMLQSAPEMALKLVPAPQPFVHTPSCSFSTQTSAFVKRLMCRSHAKGHTFVHMHVCVCVIITLSDKEQVLIPL